MSAPRPNPRSCKRELAVRRPAAAKGLALAALLAVATAVSSFAAPHKTPTKPDPSQIPAAHTEKAAPHVPRPAPDFFYDGVGGKKSLHGLRGQPVILVIVKSPKAKIFRKQTELLDPVYTEFAGKKAVFVAAFTEAEGDVKSNIPFVVANNGAAVASAFDMHGDILVAVIGKDGNIDLITDQLVPPWRMRETIVNNFAVQSFERKEPIKGPPVPQGPQPEPPPPTQPSPKPQ